MYKLSILVLSTIFICTSCYDEPESEDFTVAGLKPIYIERSTVGTAQSESPLAFDNLGKIVTNDGFIYINEIGKGIHVIDNADPTNPVSKQFWSIPGNLNFTIKDTYLYADNGFDLLTIDIQSPDAISILYTQKDFYSYDPDNNFPAGYQGFFECVDPSVGVVLDWEETTLTNPECRI